MQNPCLYAYAIVLGGGAPTCVCAYAVVQYTDGERSRCGIVGHCVVSSISHLTLLEYKIGQFLFLCQRSIQPAHCGFVGNLIVRLLARKLVLHEVSFT